MKDPEFMLAVACCRWNFAGGDGGDIAAMATEIDWPRLLRMIERHRVQALAWHCLAQLKIAIPAPIRAVLAARSAHIVEQNLRAAVECARLRDAFSSAGVRMIFVKGLTLGVLAYRGPYLKMGIDIDLLIDPGRAADAAEVLADAGYQPSMPTAAPSNSDAIADWHRLHKESVWSKTDGQIQLDLHTRLASQPLLLPGVGLDSPRQSVRVADGIDLPTLDDDTLIAYLCVHGASSAWFRLKWASDLAALLHRASPAEIERLYRYSQAIGAGSAAGQAFLLCRTLFRVDIGGALERRLRGNWVNRALERIAMRELAGRPDLKEPTERRLGTAMIHFSQLLLVDGAGNRVGEVVRQAREALSARTACQSAASDRKA